MKNPYLRYLAYALLFVLYMFLSYGWLGDLRQELILKQKHFIGYYLVSSLQYLLIGILIGAETLRQNVAKKGKWSLHGAKLVGLCLPLLLISFLPALLQFGYLTQKAVPAFLSQGLAPLIAIVALGYGLTTTLHKK